MAENLQPLKETCLAARHAALGARMVPFAGWRMPVQYTGILEEHLHTRSAAGLFDTCHMGEFSLQGHGAGALVARLVTCRTDNLAVGQARYGLLLNERGGVIDDQIVFRLADEEFMIVVNAGTLEKDRAWIAGHAEAAGVSFTDDSALTGKLDLQGPKSGEVMAALAGAEAGAVTGLKRFHHCFIEVEGVTILVSRTGYTGEFGYELFLPVKATPWLWDRLLSFEPVRPIGLGARDTLRLEKGLPLYGHELDEEHTPLEAGLERFVYFDKDFIGREALLAQKERGVERVLTGFICEGRRAAREGFTVSAAKGVDGAAAEGTGAGNAPDRRVGRVTSGAFSPCLTRGIGLAYVRPDVARPGEPVVLTDGRIEIGGEVKKPPFV